MGWFTSIKSAVSSAAAFVSDAFSKVREVGARVLGAMADYGERIVGSIKTFYAKAKPWLARAAALAGEAKAYAPYPWMKSALDALEKGLHYMSTFDETPLAKKLDDAVSWAIATARRVRDSLLSQHEAAQAEAHRKTMEEASAAAQDEAASHALAVGQFLIESMLVRTRIHTLLEGDTVTDFDHYLRLAAARKLLANAEKQLKVASTVDAITPDDMFLVKASDRLLAETPDLSPAELERLDAIVEIRFGKALLPFVFDELVTSWAADFQTRETAHKKHESALIDLRIRCNRQVRAQKLGALSAEEAAALPALQAELEAGTQALARSLVDNERFRLYVQAAEGFLVLLENDAAALAAEGLSYLAHSGVRVAQILFECLQLDRPWTELAPDEQALVVDFSNIFEQRSRARAEKLVEVEV